MRDATVLLSYYYYYYFYYYYYYYYYCGWHMYVYTHYSHRVSALKDRLNRNVNGANPTAICSKLAVLKLNLCSESTPINPNITSKKRQHLSLRLRIHIYIYIHVYTHLYNCITHNYISSIILYTTYIYIYIYIYIYTHTPFPLIGL